jgi:hypothetical protein
VARTEGLNVAVAARPLPAAAASTADSAAAAADQAAAQLVDPLTNPDLADLGGQGDAGTGS